MSSEEFDAKCPHCKTELSVPIELKGTMAPCPNCNKVFLLNPALRVRRELATAISPNQNSLQPANNGAIGSTCPHCNANISPTAIVCTNCGVIVKTGKKIDKVRQLVHPQFNILSAIVVPVLLASVIGGGAWYYSHYRNEKAEEMRIAPQIDNERIAKEQAEQQRLAKEQDKLKEEQDKLKEEQDKLKEERLRVESLHTQAEKDRQAVLAKARTLVIQISSNELNNLQEADKALKNLQKEPESVVALRKISTTATDCSDPDVKAVLLIVSVFAELSRGDYKMAESAMAYLKEKIPESPYLAQIKISKFQLPCTHCRNGDIRTPCSACQGSGRCVTCSGRGRRSSTKNPNLSLAGPRDIGARTYPERTYQDCKVCKGSGQCQTCKGNSFMSTKCTFCKGTRAEGCNAKLASQELMRFLKEKAIPFVDTRLLDAKGLIIFEGTEITPAERDLILAERERTPNESVRRPNESVRRPNESVRRPNESVRHR
jgi:hypothetical protein